MRYVHQHHNVAPICDCTVSRHYPLEANSATQSESSPDHTGIMMMGNPHERYCSLSWQMVSYNPSACPCNTHINLYCMTLSHRMYHHVALYSAKRLMIHTISVDVVISMHLHRCVHLPLLVNSLWAHDSSQRTHYSAIPHTIWKHHLPYQMTSSSLAVIRQCHRLPEWFYSSWIFQHPMQHGIL